MAAEKRPSSKVICFHMAIALTLFYIVYYMVASLLFGAFRLQSFDGKIPFDFERCCVSNSIEIVNMLSMVLTFLISTGLFLIFIRSQMWDYVITISLLHLGISCLVMQSFPKNWQWWLTFGLCLIVMVILGEVTCYLCFNKKKEQIHPTRESQRNLVT